MKELVTSIYSFLPIVAIFIFIVYKYIHKSAGIDLGIERSKKIRKKFQIIFVFVFFFLIQHWFQLLSKISKPILDYSEVTTLKEFAFDLNNYSDLIIAISTLVLVITSITYIVLSNRILHETKETKLIEIRPILSVSFNEIKINDKEKITGKILLQNLSKSFIVDLSGGIEKKMDDLIYMHRSFEKSKLPLKKLEPMGSVEEKFVFDIEPTAYLYKIEYDYFDIQKNFYEYECYLTIKERYNYIHLDYERLYMTPYESMISKRFGKKVKIYDFKNKNRSNEF